MNNCPCRAIHEFGLINSEANHDANPHLLVVIPLQMISHGTDDIPCQLLTILDCGFQVPVQIKLPLEDPQTFVLSWR